MKKIIINDENIKEEPIIKQSKNYKVEFNNLISIIKDKHQLKMNLLNKKHNIIEREKDNEIKYKDILEGIDLKYQCQKDKIKESLIIKTKQESYDYDFVMDIGDLEPNFNEQDNTLHLLQAGKTIYKIESPYMEDSNGKQSEECSYEIKQVGKQLIIHLHCDADWINDKDRLFPIIVDPTIEVNNEEEKEEKNKKQYREYEIGQEGKAKINLIDLKLAYEHSDNIIIQEKQLSIELKHNYDEENKEDNKAYLGKGWRSNLHQYIDKSQEYDSTKGYKEITYVDGKNERHIFKEYWYYNDINEVKKYVDRQEIYLDSDQKLKYQEDENHIYEVQNEIKNDDKLIYISGMNLTSFEEKKKVKGRYYVSYGFGKREIDIKNISQNLQFYCYEKESQKKIYLNPQDVIKTEEGYFSDKDGNVASIELEYKNIITKNKDGIYVYKYLQTDKITHQISVKTDGIIICEEEEEENQELEDIYQNEDITNINNQIVNTKRYIEEISLTKERAIDTYNTLLKQLSNQIQNYNLQEQIKSNYQTMQDVQEELKEAQKQFNVDIGNYCLEFLGVNNGINKNTLKYYGPTDINTPSVVECILNAFNYLYQRKSNLDTGTDSYQNAENEYKELTKQIQIKQEKEALASIVEQLSIYEKEIGRTNINLEASQQQLNALKATRQTLIDQQKKQVNDFIMDEEGNTLGFDGYGRLILIQDKYENKINIEYGYELEDQNKMLSVYTDSQKIKFNYDKESGLLTSLIDSKGRNTTYTYSNNLLMSINENDRLTSFDYTNGIKIITPLLERLEIIKNSDGSVNVKRYCLEGSINENTTINEAAEQRLISDETYQLEDNSLHHTVVINDHITNDNVQYLFSSNGMIIKEETEKYIKYKEYLEDKIIFSGLQDKRKETILNISPSSFIGWHTYTIGVISNKIKPQEIMGLKIKVSQTPSFDLGVTVIQDQEEQIEYKKQIPEGNKERVYILCFKVNRNKALSLGIACSNNGLLQSSMIESIEVIILNEYTIYSYDENKNLIKEESESGISEYLDYNDKGQYQQSKTKNIYNEEIITRYNYNDKSQITYIEDNKKNVKEYIYDDKGNLEKIKSYNKKDASLMKIEEQDKEAGIKYQYDFHTGELLSISSSTKGINNSTSFTYNYGLLTSMTHHGMKVNYEYDGQGRKTKISLNGEEVINNIYEDKVNDSQETSISSCIKSTTSNGLIEETYFDKEGKQILSKYFSNDYQGSTKYQYNDQDLISEIESQKISQLNNEVDNEKIINTYDIYDAIIKQEKKINNQVVLTIENTYDNHHRNITSYTINAPQVNYALTCNHTYNEEQQLTKITYSERTGNRGYYATYNTTYNYDVLGRIKHQNLHNNKIDLCHEYAYLQRDEQTFDLISEDITKIKINNGNQTTYLTETTTYEYDDKGNIISITTDDHNIRYHYDSLNRLIREDNSLIDKTITYQYDSSGNILLKRISSYTSEDKLISPTVKEYVYDCDKKDQLISYDNKPIKYDALGRPTIYKGDEYEWNYQGQLISITKQNQDEIKYYYDINGSRIKKVVNNIETTYITNGNQIIAIKQGNITLYLRYALNKLIGFNYNDSSSSKDYIYQRNIQGDIIAIYDSYGNQVGEYHYDGYGNVTISKDIDGIASLNPFRYRGYYYDNETGLYYLNSRYYDSNTGRFISPDILSILDISKSHINGLNLFAYCYDNPIMFIDPSGKFAILIGLIIGALIGFGTVAYIDYHDDGKIFNGSVAWYEYVGGTVLGGIVGAVLGAFAGMSFSISIPTFGLINSGGALMFGVTGTMAVTITGAQVLGVAGLLGATYMFAKGNGPRIGHNQYENKQFNSLCNKYKLTKVQRRILHDYISGQNYSYNEIEQLIIELFFS